MSVYVDDMRAPFGRMIMCHMIADTREELDAMADRIGVQRRWIQKPGTAREHYDVSLGARAKAVQAGAIEITARETVRRCAERGDAQLQALVARRHPECHHDGPRAATTVGALRTERCGACGLLLAQIAGAAPTEGASS